MFPRSLLERLLDVLTVAEEGTIQGAALKLHRDPSVVSRHIHEFQDTSHLELFHSSAGRHGGIVLTPAGEAFIAGIERAMRELDRAMRVARRLQHKTTGAFKVGYSSYLHPDVLAILQKLRFERAHEPPIELRSSVTWNIRRDVLNGELDAGFGLLPIPKDDLIVREVWNEPLMLCLPKTHPLASKFSVLPKELTNERIIRLARHSLPSLYEWLHDYLTQTLDIRLEFVGDAYHPLEGVHLVVQGAGLCFVPMATAAFRHDAVVFLPIADNNLVLTTGVFIARNNESELMDDFLRLTTKVFKEARQHPGSQRRTTKKPPLRAEDLRHA